MTGAGAYLGRAGLVQIERVQRDEPETGAQGDHLERAALDGLADRFLGHALPAGGFGLGDAVEGTGIA